MSEPKEIALSAEEVVPGVWHWAIHDDRIDYESDAHAIVEGDRVVLIDPLRLDDAALRRLGIVEAICLTAACHQRSAWRYRKEFGVKVYAPQGIRPMEEEPDVYYHGRDRLPGGLQTIHTPGPENVHYAFWLARDLGVLFCPDLLTHGQGQALQFVPAEYHDDPAATRQSVRRLLDFRFSTLCFNHGPPIMDNPHVALREILRRNQEQPGRGSD
jgi:hypothetical protein